MLGALRATPPDFFRAPELLALGAVERLFGLFHFLVDAPIALNFVAWST